MTRSDHYTRRARHQGYPARSVFKLREMQERFRLIAPRDRVLDIGAAPGSWSAYALSVCGAVVVAVDLNPLSIAASPGLTALVGDISCAKTVSLLAELGPYDVILSDAAPATTGNRIVDTGRSEALVEQVIALADRLLRPGGNLAVKIFQGSGQNEILRSLRSIFETVRAFKPQASRSESFETYFLGMRKRERTAPGCAS